jgi:hypothetical protein
VDKVKTELQVQNLLQIENNQRTFVINFHQDFTASMYSDFF